MPPYHLFFIIFILYRRYRDFQIAGDGASRTPFWNVSETVFFLPQTRLHYVVLLRYRSITVLFAAHLQSGTYFCNIKRAKTGNVCKKKCVEKNRRLFWPEVSSSIHNVSNTLKACLIYTTSFFFYKKTFPIRLVY